MSDYVIEAENIVKAFSTGDKVTRVLNGVSLKIKQGEFVVIMGPSGSGKSTLLFAISGIDTGDSGEVMFDGRSISGLSENEIADVRRTQMGFVFQQPTMLKNLNILDNVILPSLRDNKNSREVIVKKARSVMKKLGIAHLEKREINQTSGGELQRTEICRALMNTPKVIFGDEPTGALNSKTSEEIMAAFEQINAEGTAVVLVTHDARVAVRAGRVIFMRDGNIVTEEHFASATPVDDRRLAVAETMQKLGI